MKTRLLNPFILSVICALISFAISFVLIPRICIGWIDSLWMGLMVVLPVAAAVVLLRMIDYRKPVFIFLGLLIQYALLIAFAGPISELWGTSIKSALGWFSYIGTVFPWPVVITLIQYLTVVVIKKSKI